MLKLTKDFDTVKKKYLDVIKNTPKMKRFAMWDYGKHPTDEMIKDYIDHDEMYVMQDDDTIVGMVAIVMSQDHGYANVHWARVLKDDEVSTLHIFAVVPEYTGKYFGLQMLRDAIELSKKAGKKGIRLDVLRSNIPAQLMYEKAGFSYRGMQRLYAENTGWADFCYYEKLFI